MKGKKFSLKRTVCRKVRMILSLYLILAMMQLFPCLPVISAGAQTPQILATGGNHWLAVKSDGTSEIENEYMQLGTLSQIYESKGNPGAISGGHGDWGGVSYGAYQFASKFNVPYLFVQWLKDKHPSYHERLDTAYKNDGDRYAGSFNEQWRTIAKEDHNTFLHLQHQYTKVNYYDKTVNKLMNEIGFDVNKYSIALKNVVWSRSVQHGWSGGANIIITAISAINLNSASEEELIRAIYSESGMVVDYPPRKDSKQMDDGRYMKYFSRNSAAVQQSVWERLNVNELNDAIKMVTESEVVSDSDNISDNGYLDSIPEITYDPGEAFAPYVFIEPSTFLGRDDYWHINNTKMKLDWTLEDVKELLGEPDEVIKENSDFFWMINIKYPAIKFSLYFHSRYEEATRYEEDTSKIYRMSFKEAGVYGPRNIHVGETFESVVSKFPREEGSSRYLIDSFTWNSREIHELEVLYSPRSIRVGGQTGTNTRYKGNPLDLLNPHSGEISYGESSGIVGYDKSGEPVFVSYYVAFWGKLSIEFQNNKATEISLYRREAYIF